MLPFILAQSHTPLTPMSPSALKSLQDRELAFFQDRGIQVPDIYASVTRSEPQGTRFTGTPPGNEPFSDSQEDNNPPDIQHDDP